jgi:hypothetical protein
MSRRPIRAIAITVFVIGICFFNYSRIAGCDCIRTIHVVNLLACGMAIGVLISNVIGLIRGNKVNQP